MTSVSIPGLPMVWAHIAAFAAALSLSAAVPGPMTGLLPPVGAGWDGGLLPLQAPTLPSPNGGGKKTAGDVFSKVSASHPQSSSVESRVRPPVK